MNPNNSIQFTSNSNKFSGNTATSYGGVFYCQNNSASKLDTLLISSKNSLEFSNNTAKKEGGVAYSSSQNITLTSTGSIKILEN